MSNKTTFKSFTEFWHLTRSLTNQQQKILWASLSRREKRKLDISFYKGGWNDLFMRNVLDEKIDEVEKQTGINLLDLRVKILHGKSFHLTNDFWEYLRKTFEDYRPEALEYIFGGISFEEDKDKVIATLDSQS